MILTLVSAACMLALGAPIDTTVSVERGQRLEVNSFGGDITVKVWARNAVRVQADPSSRTEISVTTSGSTVSVRTQGRRGPAPRSISTSPYRHWMALDLSGVYTDVNVDGSRGPVAVETVQGDVEVSGGEGQISLSSVQGSVTLRNAKGRIEVHSVNRISGLPLTQWRDQSGDGERGDEPGQGRCDQPRRQHREWGRGV